MSSKTYTNPKYKSYTTIGGLSKLMYRSMKASSKKRGMDLPNFSYDEFYKWLTSRPDFSRIFNSWVDYDYHKMFRPSVDRKNTNKSYTFENMVLTTWSINNSSNYFDRLMGNSKELSPVMQFDLEGNHLNSYFSIAEAKRQTGCCNIHSVIQGKRKTDKGFVWKRR